MDGSFITRPPQSCEAPIIHSFAMVAPLGFLRLQQRYNSKKHCTNQTKSYNNFKLVERVGFRDMKVMIKRMLFLVVLAVLLVSLFGCNTISGIGQDISGAADTVEGWITKP